MTVPAVADYIGSTFRGVASKPSIVDYCMYTVSDLALALIIVAMCNYYNRHHQIMILSLIGIQNTRTL